MTSWPDGPIRFCPFLEKGSIYAITVSNDVEKNAVKEYFCPSRRKPTQVGSPYLMDYASATPADSPNSWDQYWYGNVWGTPSNTVYRGAIVRAKTVNCPINMAKITDGTSNVLLVSEKRLNTNNYFTGDWHDDQGWTDAWDPDTVRYTGYRPQKDPKTGVNGYEFGSAHPGRINALLCDGSVRVITYTVDATVFNNMGDRMDGNPVQLP